MTSATRSMNLRRRVHRKPARGERDFNGAVEVPGTNRFPEIAVRQGASQPTNRLVIVMRCGVDHTDLESIFENATGFDTVQLSAQPDVHEREVGKFARREQRLLAGTHGRHDIVAERAELIFQIDRLSGIVLHDEQSSAFSAPGPSGTRPGEPGQESADMGCWKAMVYGDILESRLRHLRPLSVVWRLDDRLSASILDIPEAGDTVR